MSVKSWSCIIVLFVTIIVLSRRPRKAAPKACAPGEEPDKGARESTCAPSAQWGEKATLDVFESSFESSIMISSLLPNYELL